MDFYSSLVRKEQKECEDAIDQRSALSEADVVSKHSITISIP